MQLVASVLETALYEGYVVVEREHEVCTAEDARVEKLQALQMKVGMRG